MYDRLLIPVDGSTGAARAVEYGLSVARATDAAVDLLYVVDTSIDRLIDPEEGRTLLDRSEKAGRRVTADIQKRETDLDIDREIRHGKPYEEILAHADDRDIDLCVLGTRGAGDRRLGSTAERVVTLADVPVVSVPDVEDLRLSLPEPLADIVVATDGSDAAERAADHALAIGERFGATLHAVYVIDSTVYDLEDAPRSIVGLLREGGETVIEEITSSAQEVNVPATGQVLRGAPASELCEYADGVDAGLIAVGTRGREGVPDRLLGSTTRRIIRDAERPVLSLR
ncbi:universal stress protein UspA [Halalkaliarchaeum desulfuricum]|uniref:Universal stress protein UspA n=1 Tax=Halalkaliarchaeum desulfuricum TaxID=2055893 RepID=A0A343TLK4_9EURY|nr:universal stress protein [Halalkaliarchaeum desulfuricum]AUX09976.1 universal stress protein UspA [Halalkaliarchaeum desulfuricum]